MPASEPLRITFMRSRVAQRGFLVDADLNLYSLEELRTRAADSADFVIIDESTSEDVTRILLA